MEGARVQLLVTCLVDSFVPEVGRASLKVLEGSGCRVSFPEGQTCCGQPAMNVGLTDEARQMAAHTLDVLDQTEGPVVVPSGSCAQMMIERYPRLFEGTGREDQANRVAGRVRELTQFLVNDIGAEATSDCGGCAMAYHYSCHGLRGLGLDETADTLLDQDERVPFEGDRECCGFGGWFSVDMAAVSAAIMDEKLDRIERSGAELVVGGDVSCLMHIEGGLRRRGSGVEVKHIAEVLKVSRVHE